jgi:hypothetical protein
MCVWPTISFPSCDPLPSLPSVDLSKPFSESLKLWFDSVKGCRVLSDQEYNKIVRIVGGNFNKDKEWPKLSQEYKVRLEQGCWIVTRDVDIDTPRIAGGMHAKRRKQAANKFTDVNQDGEEEKDEVEDDAEYLNFVPRPPGSVVSFGASPSPSPLGPLPPRLHPRIITLSLLYPPCPRIDAYGGTYGSEATLW